MTDTYGSQEAPPPWLDGSLPGDSGFNPLGLSSDPDSLKWNVQAEFVHCRWAMLGADGIFIHEFLTKIGILNTPSWYTAGQIELFSRVPVLENFTEHLKRKNFNVCVVYLLDFQAGNRTISSIKFWISFFILSRHQIQGM